MSILRIFRAMRPSWFAFFFLAAALVRPAIVLAEATARDPVEALRQALRSPVFDPKNAAELSGRRAILEKRVAALRGVGDLRRALLLHEWQDVSDQDPQVAEIDRNIRNELVRRMERSIAAIVQSPDPTARLAAATAVSEMATSARNPETRDRPTDSRAFARTLGPVMVRLTEDPTPSVRIAAARALSNINPNPREAVPPLARLLEGDDVEVRRGAAGALSNLIERVNQLNPARGGHGSTGFEATPAEAIATAVAVVPVCGQGLGDSDAQVRRLCLAGIQQAGIVLTDLLPSADMARTPGDIAAGTRPGGRALPEEGREAVGPLIRALGEQIPGLMRVVDDRDPQIRVLACHTLEDLANARVRLTQRSESAPPLPPPAPGTPDRRQGSLQSADTYLVMMQRGEAGPAMLNGLLETLPSVETRLTDPDVRVRLAALDYLEILGPDAAPAIPAIVRALRDPVLFVRWAAARTLGKIGPRDLNQTVPALACLLCDQDLDLRIVVAGVLEHFGPDARAAIPALTASVSRGDAEYRVAAIRAIEAIGQAAQSAIPALTDALSNADVRVRRAAAEALGLFGPAARSAESALRRALDDSDPDVRRAASDALLNILAPLEVAPDNAEQIPINPRPMGTKEGGNP